MKNPNVPAQVAQAITAEGLAFADKPVLIGGMAMEHYGLRTSGPDIDLVVSDRDYQRLAAAHPNSRKDLYGDLGVLLGPFEIWRSIALFDYAFFREEAEEHEAVYVLSPQRLLLTRVCALEVPKYQADLKLLEEYFYTKHRNQAFLREAETHIPSYDKNGGVVLGGQYEDA